MHAGRRRSRSAWTMRVPCVGLCIVLILSCAASLCKGFQPGPVRRTRVFTDPDAESCQRSGMWGAYSVSPLFMSSEVNEDERKRNEPSDDGISPSSPDEKTFSLQSIMETIQRELGIVGKRPPIQVDDVNLVFYDVFLIINLVVSSSFWAVHRLQLDAIGAAFSEGCLQSLMWIGAGLYTGVFLDSALDGHYGVSDERGGPKAAGALAFHTYINAINLRLIVALIMAVIEHRQVGSTPGEQLIPLEVGFGLILMTVWRFIHSSMVPRI